MTAQTPETRPYFRSAVRLVTLACAATLALSCKSGSSDAAASAPSAAQGQPGAGGDSLNPELSDENCKPELVVDLKHLMDCRLASFASQHRGDKESFMRALEALRNLAPPDPRYTQPGDPNNWMTLVDTQIAEASKGNLKATCKQCHSAYMRDYRRNWRDRRIDEVLGGPVP